jgi:hypothetical protein
MGEALFFVFGDGEFCSLTLLRGEEKRRRRCPCGRLATIAVRYIDLIYALVSTPLWGNPQMEGTLSICVVTIVEIKFFNLRV